MKMTETLKLAGLGVLTAAVSGSGAAAPHKERTDQSEPAAQHELEEASLIIEIGGMTCSYCASVVEEELRAVPGVTVLAVHATDGVAHIRPAEGLEPEELELQNAVERAGFNLHSVRRSDS